MSSAQFTFADVSQVSSCLVSHRLLLIPRGALEVLKEGGADEPSRSSSMEQFAGGETVCAAHQPKRYCDSEDLCGEERELNNQ